MKQSPATIAKAAALVPYIVARQDGTYRVAGEHGTYTVRPQGNDYACDCIARKTCAHRLAVIFLRKTAQQKAS